MSISYLGVVQIYGGQAERKIKLRNDVVGYPSGLYL